MYIIHKAHDSILNEKMNTNETWTCILDNLKEVTKQEWNMNNWSVSRTAKKNVQGGVSTHFLGVLFSKRMQSQIPKHLSSEAKIKPQWKKKDKLHAAN